MVEREREDQPQCGVAPIQAAADSPMATVAPPSFGTSGGGPLHAPFDFLMVYKFVLGVFKKLDDSKELDQLNLIYTI